MKCYICTKKLFLLFYCFSLKLDLDFWCTALEAGVDKSGAWTE